MTRPMLLIFALVAAALATPAAAKPVIVPSALLGTYACHGTDVRGRPVTGRLGFTYADGTEPMFFARLTPKKPVTFIDETWAYESADTGFTASPNPNSLDSAMYRSGGWKNGKITWVRMAAESTLSRTIEQIPGGVRLTVKTAGAEAKSIGYTVRCKRLPNGA
jgi:hypothetical protein